MQHTTDVIDALERAPNIVVPLVREVPPAVLKRRPPSGKWSAHEHACHLAVVHRLFVDRLDTMLSAPAPVIRPYDPGSDDPDDRLLTLDLDAMLAAYVDDRRALVARVRQLTPDEWSRAAEHGEYSHYSGFIMFRHLALHDFLHAYRIEELCCGGNGLRSGCRSRRSHSIAGLVCSPEFEEVLMKRFAIAVLVAVSASFGLRAQQAVPEIPFDSVPNALKLPPDLNFGEDAGVAVNSKGHVFVYTRSNSATGSAYGGAASQLLEFDQNGKFLREIGKGLYAWAFAHVVRIDKDDNIWAVDKGSDMIIRFNPEGHVTMVFGRKKEASDKEAEPWERNRKPPLPPVDGQFRQPTDVAWTANGDIFISDGYVNSRVAKFDKNGDWVKSFGEPGDGPGQLNTPHSIAIDAKGNVYVANRGNVRIEVYDSDGKYQRQIKLDAPVPRDAKVAIGNTAPPNAPPGTMSAGAPWAICITPGPNQVLYAADAYPGRIYKVSLDGKVLGVLGKAGKQLKQFGWIHEISCPSENELWVAEILNWRVQKLLLHPERTAGATK